MSFALLIKLKLDFMNSKQCETAFRTWGIAENRWFPYKLCQKKGGKTSQNWFFGP